MSIFFTFLFKDQSKNRNVNFCQFIKQMITKSLEH